LNRQAKLARLRMELAVGNRGVFIVTSAQTPVLDGPTLALGELLAQPRLADQLRAHPGTGPIEVVADKGVDDQLLSSLNHRRDQLRVDRALLLVFDPADSARVSRVADDLWKWATLVELDRVSPTWAHVEVHGEVASDRYAPALDPAAVTGPSQAPTAPTEDPDS
jgi:hypothetical protein